MAKKIGIVIYDYALGYSELVINTALILADEGYDVDIFVDTATYERSKIDFRNEHIAIHTIDDAYHNEIESAFRSDGHWSTQALVSAGVRRILKLPHSSGRDLLLRGLALAFRWVYDSGTLRERLLKQNAAIRPDLFEFYEKLAPSIVDDSYTCLLAFHIYALLAATMVVQSSPQVEALPVVYFSMELLPETGEPSPGFLSAKSLERSCAQSSYFVVIQDEARAAHFRRATGVSEDKLVYVPVSGLRKPYYGRGDYFRKLFDISLEKRILLHAGDLSYSMCLEIAEAARSWADDLVLVLHSPLATASPGWLDSTYLDELKRAAQNNKVYLSLNPVDWQHVPELVSSADIGLVFYDRTCPNMYEIGRSSNKLVQYLQVGLPIVAIDFPSLKEVTQECRCGETTPAPDGIEAQARIILADYEAYRNHAFKCYEERYSISAYFDNVLERIRKIE